MTTGDSPNRCCLEQGCRRSQPFKIRRGPLSGRVYLLARWKTVPHPYKDEGALLESVARHDITEEFEAFAQSERRWWGSDCTECGNATANSMRCDACGSEQFTVALFLGPSDSRESDDEDDPSTSLVGGDHGRAET